jgi:hypothetical protein
MSKLISALYRRLITMSKLISALYRQGCDIHTKMRVGFINMQLVSIKFLVHLCVGILTLVASLFVLRCK